MENTKKILSLLFLLLFLATNFSCEKDDPVGDEEYTGVNNWILANMQTYYLWNEQIPTGTSKQLNPKDYFKSLLYQEDRFSWIQENYADLLESLVGIETEAGYNYRLARKSEGSQELVGIILYIKPNSPASKTELKRGDLFNSINGTTLTISNYEKLLDALSSPHTLEIVDYPEFNKIKDITLSVIKYEENPVLLDTVYNIAGKKIGYLLYNFFAQDKGDNTLTYAKELNDIFGQFKATGINELILDLRYNSGGALTTSSELSSMISNRTGSDLFGTMQYNKIVDEALKKQEGADYNKFYFADNLERRNSSGTLLESVPINKLPGLSRLFVITSTGTASASEVLINGLKAYMDVILIGDVTYGKNVGSITIYEEDPQKQKTNKWGMQPIIVKIANAKGSSDFGNGFTPDVEISEYKHLPFLPLGDTNEVMLNAALVRIGVMQASASLRANKNTLIPVASSMDRTPARRNMYIGDIKIHE